MSNGNQTWQCKRCGTLISFNYNNWINVCPGCGAPGTSAWNFIAGDVNPNTTFGRTKKSSWFNIESESSGPLSEISGAIKFFFWLWLFVWIVKQF